jgi:hypothetical protein
MYSGVKAHFKLSDEMSSLGIAAKSSSGAGKRMKDRGSNCIKSFFLLFSTAMPVRHGIVSDLTTGIHHKAIP